MHYTVRHFDLPLLEFEADMDSAETNLRIVKVYDENRAFLPLNLTVSEDGLGRWLRHRTIPKNRAYVDALLSKVGLSLNRPLGIITVCKGLSLNDCFWVDAEGSGDTFAKVNLYDNRFSQVLAAIAFTGYGSSVRTSLASCPEFSTNGMLPKCWRRMNGKIYLYKGGTVGFSNTGFEPYSELYAYQVAQAMGLNAIRYTLTKDLKKTLCSKCELFTSKEYSYLPVGQLVPKGGMKAVRAYYETLGQPFVDALEDMVVFDAVICNTDRHYGNFGVLVKNETNCLTTAIHCSVWAAQNFGRTRKRSTAMRVHCFRWRMMIFLRKQKQFCGLVTAPCCINCWSSGLTAGLHTTICRRNGSK